jgi:hypothetical protein
VGYHAPHSWTAVAQTKLEGWRGGFPTSRRKTSEIPEFPVRSPIQRSRVRFSLKENRMKFPGPY